MTSDAQARPLRHHGKRDSGKAITKVVRHMTFLPAHLELRGRERPVPQRPLRDGEFGRKRTINAQHCRPDCSVYRQRAGSHDGIHAVGGDVRPVVNETVRAAVDRPAGGAIHCVEVRVVV